MSDFDPTCKTITLRGYPCGAVDTHVGDCPRNEHFDEWHPPENLRRRLGVLRAVIACKITPPHGHKMSEWADCPRCQRAVAEAGT